MSNEKNWVTRATAQKILDWCYFTYGRSKINGAYPALEFRKPDDYTGDDYGYYDEIDQTIFVNREIEKCLFTGDLGGLDLYKQLDVACTSISAKYEVRGATIFVNGKSCK